MKKKLEFASVKPIKYTNFEHFKLVYYTPSRNGSTTYVESIYSQGCNTWDANTLASKTNRIPFTWASAIEKTAPLS